jgi:hypothetical protein
VSKFLTNLAGFYRVLAVKGLHYLHHSVFWFKVQH